MNMAVVLKAPVIFAFENNHYSEHTGDKYAVGAKTWPAVPLDSACSRARPMAAISLPATM